MVASELDKAFRVQVEQLVVELESRYSREQIERSIQDASARYRDAKVTAFVPTLVYRDARLLLSGQPEP